MDSTKDPIEYKQLEKRYKAIEKDITKKAKDIRKAEKNLPVPNTSTTQTQTTSQTPSTALLQYYIEHPDEFKMLCEKVSDLFKGILKYLNDLHNIYRSSSFPLSISISSSLVLT
jgi:hypothetical protein